MSGFGVCVEDRLMIELGVSSRDFGRTGGSFFVYFFDGGFFRYVVYYIYYVRLWRKECGIV